MRAAAVSVCGFCEPMGLPGGAVAVAVHCDGRCACSCPETPGARPGAVEGSGSPDTVVGVQTPGDHAAPGGSLSTLTVGQLVEALDGLPAHLPLRLEVLGDVIDTDGVVIDRHEVRIVGGEE